ncbi:MAG: hypothetical protein DRQ51_09145 [Gammaproteobacteria bacterium]|nr:MAG: hypothetical protein DRQ51_09145 [Gammaproteobacteria bacterium]
MKKTTTLNNFFAKLPDVLRPFKWLIIVLYIATTAFMLYGVLAKFQIDMSLESWFNEDDKSKQALNLYRQEFGSDDGVYIVYKPKDGNIFSTKSIQTLKKFHQELNTARFNNKENNLLSRIEKIDSLINIRYQSYQNNDIITAELIGKKQFSNPSQINKIKTIAATQKNFKLAYFSSDFQYGGVRIKTDFGTVIKQDEIPTNNKNQLASDSFDFTQSDNESKIIYEKTQMDEYLDFMKQLRPITKKYPHFDFYFTGNAPLMEFAMETMDQASYLIGIMILVVIALLWLLFHSWSAVFWPIVVVMSSAFWTIGLLSHFGIIFSTMVSLSFMLILSVGIADCVHVLSSYINFRQKGHEHKTAISYAYKKTGMAIFLTTITTMLGMGALTATNIPHIAVFGVSSMFGVAMAFVFTVIVLPIFIDLWHPIKQKQQQNKISQITLILQKFLKLIPAFTNNHKYPIIIIYVLIFIVFIYAMKFIKVDSNFAELTKEGSVLRLTYDIIDNKMMGGQNMEIYLDFNQDDAIKNPQILQKIDKLSVDLKTKYPQYVVKTFAISDYIKETYKTLNQGDDNFYKIPQNHKLTAQLLYLFDSSDPKMRQNLVNDEYSKTHISVMLKNAGSYEYTQFFKNTQQMIENLFNDVKQDYPEASLNVTGSLALMMELLDRMSWMQIKSFLLALGLISILLIITLGSTYAGLISIIPNLLPAIFTFGLMGLLSVPLDTDTLLIAPLIIGIAVDDTIHFMNHYKNSWYKTGDVDLSIKNTINEVGQAVTFTTLILGVGFFMLSFSDYLGLAKTGYFGSLAIFVALLTDLLLLPALMKTLKPDLGREKWLTQNKVA